MCPTTRCTSCWCPNLQMSDTDIVFPYRDTDEVRDKVAEERKRLLHRDGRPRDGCKHKVILLSYTCHTPVVYLSYSCRISVILLSYICHTYSYCLFWAVASRNNDRTVASKAFAWRLLGMMPSISKAATIVQSDEWRSERRTRLYHSCVDILAQQINDLTGRDIFLRFGDQKYRRSRVFVDFLCMDGDEVSNATMCPTTRCTSCWCPKLQMSDTDIVFPYRDTDEVRDKVAAERKRLLHRDGRPRDGCKQKVILLLYVCHTPVVFLSYSCRISVILLSYVCHTPVVCLSYSCRIYVILLSYICHTPVICMS